MKMALSGEHWQDTVGDLEGQRLLDVTNPPYRIVPFPTGALRVTGDAEKYVWATPNSSDARVTATLSGQSDRAAIFSYLEGAAMEGGFRAPERGRGYLCAHLRMTRAPPKLGEYQFVLELPEGTGDQDEATFTISPGVLHWVRDLGSSSPAGYQRATWYGVGAAVMFGLAATLLYTDFGLEPSGPDRISRHAERYVAGWILVVGGLAGIAEGTFQAVKNGRGHVQAGATTTWRDPPSAPQSDIKSLARFQRETAF